MADCSISAGRVGAGRQDEYLSATRTQSQQPAGRLEQLVDQSQKAQVVGDCKYGELAPKKKPLISKDHERAFFDSADWALCKQNAGVQKSTVVAVESLRPKLKRTPHHKLPPRMPTCTSGGDLDVSSTA